MSELQSHKRVMTGKVVSDKMNKTIVIEVVRRVQHKLYEKYITRRSKFAAHDADEACNMGDIVKIVECRPISKTKTWMLLEIVERAK